MTGYHESAACGRHTSSTTLSQKADGRTFRSGGREVTYKHAVSFNRAAATPRSGPARPPQRLSLPRPSSSLASPTNSGSKPPFKWQWRLLFLPAILVANFLIIQLVTAGQPQCVEVSYTFFKQQVDADNVAQISTRTDTIQGTFRQAVPYQPDPSAPTRTAGDFSTVIPAFANPGLETLLGEHRGTINARSLDQPSNPLITILLGFGPTLLLIGGFPWLSRKAAGQMGGGMLGMGKSQARRYDQTTIGERGVTFADVAGIEEAKSELVELVGFLKNRASPSASAAWCPTASC